uniref:Ribosomal RNA-processing protein 40 n=1 Tax=Peronospora matthiolae TaxID=2874970 RepID=A0AAV1TUB8_9STRA
MSRRMDMPEHKKRSAAADVADADASSFLDNAQRSVDFLFSPVVVLPGDDVTSALTKTTRRVKLGAGLKQLPDDRIVCTNAGVLRYRPANRYWVEYTCKRYVASLDDGVIGVVTDRNADFYRVNIGAAASAVLGMLAFDGATKRNRPNLRLGSLVYARVNKVNKNVEPEITCEAPPSVTKKDWMTGLAIYGELNDGYVFKTSIGLAKSLLHDNCQVLASLSKRLAFEVAVGVNGVVWVNAKTAKNITIISNSIVNSETMSSSEINAMVTRLTEDADDA